MTLDLGALVYCHGWLDCQRGDIMKTITECIRELSRSIAAYEKETEGWSPGDVEVLKAAKDSLVTAGIRIDVLVDQGTVACGDVDELLRRSLGEVSDG